MIVQVRNGPSKRKLDPDKKDIIRFGLEQQYGACYLIVFAY